jgi:outer membrane murein-binding lipoprotein Lpp
MISVPKAAFDAIHTLVTQLAAGLDQLKQGVDAQANGPGSPDLGAAGAPPAAGAPAGQAPEPAGPSEDLSDDEFLKGVAEQGSKR